MCRNTAALCRRLGARWVIGLCLGALVGCCSNPRPEEPLPASTPREVYETFRRELAADSTLRRAHRCLAGAEVPDPDAFYGGLTATGGGLRFRAAFADSQFIGAMPVRNAAGEPLVLVNFLLGAQAGSLLSRETEPGVWRILWNSFVFPGRPEELFAPGDEGGLEELRERFRG